jgi:hypothetical protein
LRGHRQDSGSLRVLCYTALCSINDPSSHVFFHPQVISDALKLSRTKWRMTTPGVEDAGALQCDDGMVVNATSHEVEQIRY